jgi:hypothetical protein
MLSASAYHFFLLCLAERIYDPVHTALRRQIRPQGHLPSEALTQDFNCTLCVPVCRHSHAAVNKHIAFRGPYNFPPCLTATSNSCSSDESGPWVPVAAHVQVIGLCSVYGSCADIGNRIGGDRRTL